MALGINLQYFCAIKFTLQPHINLCNYIGTGFVSVKLLQTRVDSNGFAEHGKLHAVREHVSARSRQIISMCLCVLPATKLYTLRV